MQININLYWANDDPTRVTQKIQSPFRSPVDKSYQTLSAWFIPISLESSFLVHTLVLVLW